MRSAFKDGYLKGKVAFIAGASSGINLGIAQRLAEAGAKVAILSRSADKIAAAAKTITDAGHEAIGIAADVRDYAAVDAALAQTVETFGKIDIVVSGAAGNFVAPALGMSANGFKTVIDIDLMGTFHVLRASFQYLNRPGASLISITAPQGSRPSLYQAHVCAAKAGINMLTQCLAMEWGPAGVRVNAISPGP
ncbi:MAG TPA: SDR family NAD(P)-dependent oxidoreductase, partial [Phenylobacterium sp.]|nr:SDR family NAD(P)-dependent oxidoreductase [Phenylobacterium sp.]